MRKSRGSRHARLVLAEQQHGHASDRSDHRQRQQRQRVAAGRVLDRAERSCPTKPAEIAERVDLSKPRRRRAAGQPLRRSAQNGPLTL